jgi:hypothetical protein
LAKILTEGNEKDLSMDEEEVSEMVSMGVGRIRET